MFSAKDPTAKRVKPQDGTPQQSQSRSSKHEKQQGDDGRRRKKGNVRSTQLTGRQVDARLLQEARPVIDSKAGLRRIPPYDYTFECYVKGRWFNRPLLEVFSKEFQAQSPAAYKAAIEAGRITVNGRQVSPDHILRNGQTVCNAVHRHEPPVCADPIPILYEDDTLLAVNKPSSIPVHPCGRYRHNTVIALLGHEYNKWNLLTCHRLDRLTSGLLIFAKTKAKAQELERCMKERIVQKMYICRVVGRFPQGRVECSEPIKVVSNKLGVCSVDPDGKPCHTTFRLVATDGDESIVQCLPHTGRMHQIRVHLLHLGHPIVNDPIYNNPIWMEEKKQTLASASSKKEAISRLLAEMTARLSEWGDRGDASTHSAEACSTAGGGVDGIGEDAGQSFTGNYVKVASCPDCQLDRPDPSPAQLCLYLHAYRYKLPTHEFCAPLPTWAQLTSPSVQCMPGYCFLSNGELEGATFDTMKGQTQLPPAQDAPQSLSGWTSTLTSCTIS
eukprot:m.363968 g.363968  ORF g.363968 m.363968 type:complete len:499 (+) comp24905_c0_seq1:66-1562(+)